LPNAQTLADLPDNGGPSYTIRTTITSRSVSIIAMKYLTSVISYQDFKSLPD
jgi:hypothetical protein